jgi:glycosyltransferase involved in cell wall biosynthesis
MARQLMFHHDNQVVNMKVAMIADLPEPGEMIDGGVQAVTSCLVQAMERIPGLELHVLRLRRGVDKERVLEGENHFLHVLPMSRLGTVTTFAQDQRTLDRRLSSISPDVVHSQGAGHYGVLAHRSRFPSVVTVHGILSEEVRFEPGLRNRARAALQARMSDYYCVNRAGHTILISQYVADFYGDRLAGERYLVPNPVDDRFFDVMRSEVGSKILFAGRLTERKGVKDLLQAVARLETGAETQVVLAGSQADERYVTQLRSLSSRLGIAHRVEFAGSIDTQRLTKELSECSCLVLPSYQETAPMVIQEAMAAGVPVIATGICGVPFQVSHGETGFVYPPGDLEELTGLLDRIVSSREMREQFGRLARASAYRNFRASVVAERTIEVYRSILGSGAQRRGDRA